DGGVAYELHKRFHTPYIVTIRGTDYNLFFKRLIYLRKRGLQILQNAKMIIFISPSYRQKLFSSTFFKVQRNQLVSSSRVIPNGIDDYWLKNVASRRQEVNSPIQLLYVGRFIKGKN